MIKNTHKEFSPSKSSRWMNCDAAIKLSRRVPVPPTSTYAAEGTAAHKVSELCLDHDYGADNYEGDIVEGVIVDEEMVDGVNFYIDFIRDEIKEDGGELYTEQRVEAKSFHPEIGGTVDALIIPDRLGIRLGLPPKICDLKYGRGVTVKAEDNTQGLNYALCFCIEEGWIYPEIEIIIVQPRAQSYDDKITRWTVTRKELKAFGKRVLSAIKRSESRDPEATPGDWCKFCPAAGICPALHNQALTRAQADFNVVPTDGITFMDVEELSDSQFTLILDNADMIRAYLNSVEQYALGLGMRGKRIPHRKIVESRSNRKWVDNEEETVGGLIELGLKEHECYKEKLISPAQAERKLKKLIGRGYRKSEEAEVINLLWEKPRGKPVLALLDDKRKEMISAILTGDDFVAYDD